MSSTDACVSLSHHPFNNSTPIVKHLCLGNPLKKKHVPPSRRKSGCLRCSYTGVGRYNVSSRHSCLEYPPAWTVPVDDQLPGVWPNAWVHEQHTAGSALQSSTSTIAGSSTTRLGKPQLHHLYGVDVRTLRPILPLEKGNEPRNIWDLPCWDQHVSNMLPYLTEMEWREEPISEVQQAILGRHRGA
ncbi:hypothetical protein NEOLEDRAFT_1178571 [Neolentinus lepideus HHB14362 ss-1]|uniref:Uncharacterized protein n=1 Tax=Neolentinus lepideus HHB14362 ss-1 TaxID=1314782 RepID=A0A165SH07_9AGAM|nr:hypothetical protein NEOLEDRAFT_1178571 [Neolentinus lepideus HHB14362 ss-1]